MFAATIMAMGPKVAAPSTESAWDEAPATIEAVAEAARGELMTFTPEMLDRVAELGEWPDFVRDPE